METTENTEVTGEVTQEGGAVEHQEVDVAPEDDPNESFDDFKKRKAGEALDDKLDADRKAVVREKRDNLRKFLEEQKELDDQEDEDFEDFKERKADFPRRKKELEDEIRKAQEGESDPKPEKKEEKTEEKPEEKDEADEEDPPGKGEGEDESESEEVFKYTVDGEEKTINKSDTENIQQMLAKAEASDKRFQEAAHMKREVTDFVNAVKKDPMGSLTRLGVDAITAAEELIYKDMEFKSKPEAEQRAIIAERELQKYQQKIQEMEDEKAQEAEKIQQVEQQQKFQEKYQAHVKMLQTQFTEALAQEGIPANEHTISRMAQHFRRESERGTNDLAYVAKLVAKDYQKEIESIQKEKAEKYKQKTKAREFKQSKPKRVTPKRQKAGTYQRYRNTSIYSMLD